jgi:hypothetical protein
VPLTVNRRTDVRCEHWGEQFHLLVCEGCTAVFRPRRRVHEARHCHLCRARPAAPALGRQGDSAGAFAGRHEPDHRQAPSRPHGRLGIAPEFIPRRNARLIGNDSRTHDDRQRLEIGDLREPRERGATSALRSTRRREEAKPWPRGIRLAGTGSVIAQRAARSTVDARVRRLSFDRRSTFRHSVSPPLRSSPTPPKIGLVRRAFDRAAAQGRLVRRASARVRRNYGCALDRWARRLSGHEGATSDAQVAMRNQEGQRSSRQHRRQTLDVCDSESSVGGTPSNGSIQGHCYAHISHLTRKN